MKIHTLQIVNFKSYFGRHIIGPIDNHFACIIGPNGNGKSNILDAMLFVFGFKSSKLRQDSISSLIHSSAYGMPQQAKVSVTFVSGIVDKQQQQQQGKFSQNNNNEIDQFFRQSQKSNKQYKDNKSFQNKQKQHYQHQQNKDNIQHHNKQPITISRTIRKTTNQSFYQLNNKRIQWNQLRQYLLKQHIDLQKNLFIILQGQVQRLCQLSPQKLVEYIEYVSGSDQYLQKINLLEKQYINGGISMDRVRQSYKLLRKVYTQQEKETHQLLEHVSVRIRLLCIKVIEIKRSLIIKNKQLNQQQSKLKQLQQQLHSVQQKLRLKQQQLQTLRQQYRINEKLVNKCQQKILQISQQITVIQSQHVKRLQTEIQYLVKDCKQKEKEMEIVEKEKMELVGMERMKEEIVERAKEIEDVLMNVIDDCNNNKRGQKQNQQPQLSLPQLSSPTSPKSHTITHTPQYKKLHNIINHQQSLTKLHQQLQTQHKNNLHSKQTQHKQLQQHLQTIIKQYGQNGQLYKSKQQQISITKVKLRLLLQSQNKKDKQIMAMMQSMDEINRRIKQTQQKRTFVTLGQKIINQIKTANSYNVLLPGKKIFTLRQLVHIPSQYSQFINAITPQLDFIIVDNHNDARQVIKFLNSKKLGRMSLILLDQVKKIMSGVSMEWKGQKPHNCVRMIDIVKVIDNNQYEKILYWSMGNTLIAQRLQDAMVAAYHSSPAYRVIAKNGVFIDLSGTMTKVALQSMVQEDRVLLDTRVKVLQKKIDQQVKRLAIMREQKQQVNKQLYELMMMMGNNNSNKRNNIKSNNNRQQQQQQYQQQFTTKQQLLQFMTTLKQDITQLSQQIINIKGNKATMQLQIRIKQKQLNQLIIETKSYLMKNSMNNNNNNINKLTTTFDQLLQLVQQYQHIRSKLKKIQISQHLITSLDKKLVKIKDEIKSLLVKIQQRQNNITDLLVRIKQKHNQIEELVKEKVGLVDQLSRLEQKIFVKQIDVGKCTDGSGVIQRGKDVIEDDRSRRQIKIQNRFIQLNGRKRDVRNINNNNNNNNNKNNNNNRKRNKNIINHHQQQLNSHSLMPDIQVFIDGNNNNNNNNNLHQKGQISSTTSSSNPTTTVHQLRKQQTKFKQIIQTIKQKIKSQQKHYKQRLNSLRNIYQFILQKCRNHNDDDDAHYEVKQKKQKGVKQLNNQSYQNSQNNRKKQQFKSVKKQKQNVKVNFKDIIMHYLKGKKLISVDHNQDIITNNNNNNDSQNNIKKNHSKRSQKNSKSSLKLKNIISYKQSYQLKLKQLNQYKQTIFNSFFNSFYLTKIGQKEQYVFSDFLTLNELEYIIDGKSQSLNSKDIDTLIQQQSIQQLKQDILMQISNERLKSLMQQNENRLAQLQQQSMSLVIKNNMQYSPLKEQYDFCHQLVDVDDNIDINNYNNNYTNNHSNGNNNSHRLQSFFTDQQSPLNQYQQQAILSLIKKKTDFIQAQSQLIQIQTQQKLIYTQLLSIRQQRTTCFLNTFNMINIQVNKIYNYLTKGNAEINLINSMDPFQGLEFTVRPYNKSWKTVNLLSGGEKTLTSLALIFACEEIKKFPFYFMDQIDAALDYKNVTSLGRYIKEKKNVQHIVISLRKNMYEQCDQLVCLYKVSDVTRTIVVGMRELYGRGRRGQQQQQQYDDDEEINNNNNNNNKKNEQTIMIQPQRSNASTVTL